MSHIVQKIKDWMLPIAMLTGASSYLIYHAMPEPVHHIGPVLNGIVTVMQPLLIFLMLFLTFCRIEPKELKPHRWHWWLLLVQGGSFTLMGLIASYILKAADGNAIVLIESAMLCMICPTATAAAVVTRKLGGDVPGITTYIVLINILAALLVPLVVPMVAPVAGMDFWMGFSLILAKVFPLLITPCLCAWLVRYLLPRLYRKILRVPDLAFYLWAVALTLAIAVTTKSIVHSKLGLSLLVWMSVVSLVCCVFNFAFGRYIGNKYTRRNPSLKGTDGQKSDGQNENRQLDSDREIRKVTAGQSLGQKNTVFAIWLGYTFLTPETAIIGGFYSIWHNVYNSWQLYQQRKLPRDA